MNEGLPSSLKKEWNNQDDWLAFYRPIVDALLIYVSNRRATTIGNDIIASPEIVRRRLGFIIGQSDFRRELGLENVATIQIALNVATDQDIEAR